MCELRTQGFGKALMSLLLSLFNHAFIPRPDPQFLIYPSPATAPPANQTNDKLVRSGLLFLLMPKDRYGVWCCWANAEFRLSPGKPINFI